MQGSASAWPGAGPAIETSSHNGPDRHLGESPLETHSLEHFPNENNKLQADTRTPYTKQIRVAGRLGAVRHLSLARAMLLG